MGTKKLIESLRKTANNLILNNNEVYHCEGGLRGQIEQLYAMEMPTALSPETVDTLWGKLLSVNNSSEIICKPYQSDGFSFEAAIHPGAITTEHERKLEGIGVSVFTGSLEQMKLLSRLVAAPITKHIRKYTGKDCGRKDSYYDTMTSLTEWVYIIYELGLKCEIPDLRRCYRLISSITLDGEALLCGYSDTNSVFERQWPDKNQWELLWSAAVNQEIAYSKLGTDLFIASQIALDYLAEYGFAAFADDFQKRQNRQQKRDERNIAIGRIKKELHEHLRSAKDHAITTRDNGHAKLLKRPTQKDIGKGLSISESTVSRCINDPEEKELPILWRGANNLEYVLRYRS